jgi:hypothetical protein
VLAATSCGYASGFPYQAQREAFPVFLPLVAECSISVKTRNNVSTDETDNHTHSALLQPSNGELASQLIPP